MNTEDRVFISTSCIGGRTTYQDAIDKILNTSIKNIEISGNHYYLDNFELTKIIKHYQENKVNFSLHNYFPTPSNEIVMNLLSRNEKTYKESFNVLENAFSISKQTDIKIYGVHPGYFRDAKIDNDKFKFDGNKISINESMEFYINKFQNYYKKLQSINNNIFFGLENLFPNFDKTNDSFMCTFDEIEKILNIPYVNKSNIGIILDLGHLNISSNLLEFDKYYFLDKLVDLYSDKIYEVHISENEGRFDSHDELKSDSWQLEVLHMFKNSGPKNSPTIFTLESRNLTSNKIENYHNNIIKFINI